jgi:hypothetical protein
MWLVLFMHNMLAGSLFAVKNDPLQRVPAKLVKEGRVAEVAISDNAVQGRLLGSADGESGSGHAVSGRCRVDPDISRVAG